MTDMLAEQMAKWGAGLVSAPSPADDGDRGARPAELEQPLPSLVELAARSIARAGPEVLKQLEQVELPVEAEDQLLVERPAYFKNVQPTLWRKERPVQVQQIS